MTEQPKKSPTLIAYAVNESSGKSHFTKIGAAWPNTKGGFGIRLDAFPVSPEIVLLPPQEREEAA
jgi:hypothetical protein